MDATCSITSARSKIDLFWKSIIDSAKKSSLVALSGSHFHMTQSLSGNGLLDYLTSSSSINAQKYNVSVPNVPPRHRSSLREKYIHSIQQSASSTFSTDTSIKLFDFERNVRQNWSYSITSTDYEYVWRKFNEYLGSAMSYYSGDPVGMSRCITTALKMIQVWDQCVCNDYPLLRSYKIGIKTDFIKMLLVATQEELEIVNALEEYFLKREQASNACLLEEIPSNDSFSVRFVEQSFDMESLRTVILQEGRVRAEAKIKEVEAARLYCASLRTRIQKLNHTYYVGDWGVETHAPYCNLCSLTREVSFFVFCF